MRLARMMTSTGHRIALVGLLVLLSGSPALASERCCGELEQLGFQSRVDGGACAAMSFGPTCQTSMSWKDSKDACASIGARLCRFDEVEAGVLSGLECSDQVARAWTDERCIFDFETGSSGFLSYTPDGNQQFCLSKAAHTAQVACCADPCSSSPSDNGLSKKSCEELSQQYPFRHNDGSSMCATIVAERAGLELNERSSGVLQCSGKYSWEESNSVCKQMGARLCSFQEFEKNELLSIGCNLNTQLTWSSEPCVADFMSGEIGYLAAEADGGRDARCMSRTEGRAHVVCCADMGVKPSKHVSGRE